MRARHGAGSRCPLRRTPRRPSSATRRRTPSRPTPGASTVSLAAAVATALKQNFGLLAAADTVSTSRLHETVARAQFYPKLTPDLRPVRLRPDRSGWTSGRSCRGPAPPSPRRRDFRSATRRRGRACRATSNARLMLTQPLLRGLGPNATHYDLRNSERGRESPGAHLRADPAAGRDPGTTSAFYQVVLQRQLLAVARQSLKRSESLLKASEARLQVGLVSKLDVFRAELQASQAQEAMVRAETSLQNALETFRSTLGLRRHRARGAGGGGSPRHRGHRAAGADRGPGRPRAARRESTSWRAATRWRTRGAPRRWRARTCSRSSTSTSP